MYEYTEPDQFLNSAIYLCPTHLLFKISLQNNRRPRRPGEYSHINMVYGDVPLKPVTFLKQALKAG